jgi:hypothetical protein
VPGLNSALGNPLDVLHRRPRFKFKVSDFKFAPFPKTNFNACTWTFYGGARDACVITRTPFPVICYDLGWFCFRLPMGSTNILLMKRAGWCLEMGRFTGLTPPPSAPKMDFGIIGPTCQFTLIVNLCEQLEFPNQHVTEINPPNTLMRVCCVVCGVCWGSGTATEQVPNWTRTKFGKNFAALPYTARHVKLTGEPRIEYGNFSISVAHSSNRGTSEVLLHTCLNTEHYEHKLYCLYLVFIREGVNIWRCFVKTDPKTLKNSENKYLMKCLRLKQTLTDQHEIARQF